MQHVNNVHYLQWLENVAWAHSSALGMRQEDYTRLGHGMVVRRHELDYVAPALLGDRVLLGTWIVGTRPAVDAPALPVRARVRRGDAVSRRDSLRLR